MSLIFLSVCVLKMGNRVKEQGISIRGGTLSLLLFYSHTFTRLVNVNVLVFTRLCFLGLLLFQFLGTGFLLLLVDLLKSKSFFKNVF